MSEVTEEEIVQPEAESHEGLSREQLLEELSKVRKEAAARRIENKNLKSDSDKWKQYEESQKTEMQKLQDSIAERDKALSDYKVKDLKLSVAREVGLDSDDIDLIGGTDEETIRASAQKLKERLTPKQDGTKPVELLGGNRGKPIGSNATQSIDDMIRASARR